MTAFGGLRVFDIDSDAGRLFAAGFQSAQARKERQADRELAQQRLEAQLQEEERLRQEDQAAAQAAAIIGQSLLYDAGEGPDQPGDRAVLDDQIRSMLPGLVTQAGSQGLRLLGPLQEMQSSRARRQESQAQQTAINAQLSEIDRQIAARRSLLEGGRVGVNEPAGRDILREIELLEADRRSLTTNQRLASVSEQTSLRNVFQRENPESGPEGVAGNELRLRFSLAQRVLDAFESGQDVPPKTVEQAREFVQRAAPILFGMEMQQRMDAGGGGPRPEGAAEPPRRTMEQQRSPAEVSASYNAAMQVISGDDRLRQAFHSLPAIEDKIQFIKDLAERMRAEQGG